MASEKLLHAITKHVMGDRSEFDALKERFQKDLNWCSNQSVAAALAYMIAKDELEAKKEEEEEEPDVYDEAIEVIEKYCHPPGNISAHTATDEIFTLIYKWLDAGMEKRAWSDCGARKDIKELFLPFIIEKPKV
jgi:hypothetical protein